MKKRFDNNTLKPLKTKFKTFKIASYDIETATNKNIFIQGGFIDSNGIYNSFIDKDKMIKFMLKRCKKEDRVFATFNRFDFFGLFKHTKDWNKYGINMRGGLLMWKEYRNINTYDTMSYCKSSVKELGLMLGLPKLKFDVSNNKLKMTKWEMRKMVAYNRRDCEVTREFMIGFQKVINELGGQIGQTIGSTAMDLFKRKYLLEEIHHEYIKDKEFSDGQTVKEVIFNAYHGGRTEMFKRGYSSEIYYKYDFNSLYPSVMLNEFPKPSSAMYSEREDGKLNVDTIMKYEGVSECEVVVPYMYYPILPTKMNEKLCFPIGKFRDYFTNVELRLAIENGVKVTKVYKTISYTQKFSPFVKWVNDLYALRMKYASEGNIIYKEIIKLLLNNLYGKMAMKHVNRLEMIREEDRDDFNREQEGFEFHGYGYGMRETPIDCNQTYIIPILAVYTTAYARIKLWKALSSLNGIYCDTDSIFTTTKMKDSKELGELKLEGTSNGLNIVKQKHYSEQNLETGEIKYKIKGLALTKSDDKKEQARIQAKEFENSISGIPIEQRRIVGVKQSIKGKYDINEVIYMTKKFDLDDTKRVWLKKYDKSEMNDSKPIICGFDNLKELKIYYDSIPNNFTTTTKSNM